LPHCRTGAEEQKYEHAGKVFHFAILTLLFTPGQRGTKVDAAAAAIVMRNSCRSLGLSFPWVD